MRPLGARDERRPAYTGPDAELVPPLMRELIEWLRDGDADAPACARAAMAHLNLVGIHPWRDGDGRTAHALHTLVLARTGELDPEFSSIEEWLGARTNSVQYYEALRSTQNCWRGAAGEIARATTAAVRGPGRDPYPPA
jgi:Fic family protein